MQLNLAQKQDLYADGYVLLRGAVSRVLVNSAVKAINHSLGQNGMHPDELTTMRAQSYCREITTTPAIIDLFSASPLQSICQDLLGEGNLNPIISGQVGLRFPSAGAKPWVPGPHLDGTYTPDNGVTQGTYANFTLLIGVFLSDLPEPNMGNFTVWPGTHHQYEKYFQENGSEKFFDGTPKIDLPEARQITVRAGDAALCHYQLGHSVGPNISPFIRYACFFRVLHRETHLHRKEALTNIWRDLPGMAETIGAS